MRLPRLLTFACCTRAVCAQKKSIAAEPEYFEDEEGARLEVRPELRAVAAGIRHDVAASTGALPAAVPMQWPSAAHLLQAQANLPAREVGGEPLYQWGQVSSEPTPPPAAKPFVIEQATLELVARIKAAPAREWPAPCSTDLEGWCGVARVVSMRSVAFTCGW